MEQQDVLADKISRQIPMVSADLDTIQSRIHDAEGKADKLTAADVRTMIDDIETASKVKSLTLRPRRTISQLSLRFCGRRRIYGSDQEHNLTSQ